MPEGPEVRRFADQLDRALANQAIVQLDARTKIARHWLQSHPNALQNRTVLWVSSHGKNLIGWVEGGYYFYSHLMMWGRWITFEGDPPQEINQRERARIVTVHGGAILLSAPVFQIGQGDPRAEVEILRSLGPDILPESGTFDTTNFRARLLAREQLERTIGAALLDQSIVAGIGNYLRAEILFECKIDPWRRVDRLTEQDLTALEDQIPRVARRAYETGGITVSDEIRTQMLTDPTLVYRLGSDFGSRHFVFRRTNLPCLRCGTAIRQQKQMIRADDEGEKTRIIYFCPVCQNVSVEPKPRRKLTPRSRAELTQQ